MSFKGGAAPTAITLATQVATAITKWEEHLLYRCDKAADRPRIDSSYQHPHG
jgi:hypothetical protein